MPSVKRLRWLMQPRRLMGRLTGPRVLVTSVPKCGTNMLRRTLSLFPQIRDGRTLVPLPAQQQLLRLEAMRPGQVVSTHRAPDPALDEILDRRDIKVIFILRDPRDTCVSLCHYMLLGHIFGCRRSYLQGLPDLQAQLAAVIAGIDEPSADGKRTYWPSIDRLFRHRLSWMGHPRSLVVRFEDLVGPRGGGSGDLQRAAIRAIAEYLSLRLTAQDIDFIANNVFSPDSPRFRRGQIGSWKEEMAAGTRELFKHSVGQLLIDLGYERGWEW